MRTGSLVLLLLALLLTPAYAHAPHPKAKQAKKMTLTVSVKGRGSVTSTPKGIRCPHTCTLAARRDRTVRLTAKAARAWSFAGWTLGCTSKRFTCVVHLTKRKRVAASFVRRTVPPP